MGFYTTFTCFFLLAWFVQSESNYTCSYSPPGTRECGYSCIESISQDNFLSLADTMPHCQSVYYYLSRGSYPSFPANYFSRVGHVDHFFLEITDVTFNYFPSSEETASPFSGVAYDVRIYVQLVGVAVTRGWNWKAFAAMVPMRGGTGQFHGYRLNLTHLELDFSSGFHGALTTVRFCCGNLKTLEDGVFSRFLNLREVYLHENEIVEMKRNFFSSPARRLKELILHKNKLRSLPLNMFLAMPVLQMVTVSENQLTTLDEVVFRPIYRRVSLGFQGNFLHCECKLRWVSYVHGPYSESNGEGLVCETPPKLKGRLLTSVTNEELGC